MDEDAILNIMQRNGMRIEFGAQFSAKGQIAQLLNGVNEVIVRLEELIKAASVCREFEGGE